MNAPNLLLAKVEAAGMWAYFHKDWLLEFRSQIRPQLPEAYHVFVESEAVLISPDDASPVAAILPDVSVARARPTEHGAPERLALEPTAAVIETEQSCEIFHKYNLLIRRAPDNRVSAALEILSPSNKGVGNRLDQDKHLRKRTAYLEAAVNLFEIDQSLHVMLDLNVTLEKATTFNDWTRLI